jgi:hypothetical protein
MLNEEEMRAEIEAVGRSLNLAPAAVGQYCQAGRDGDCNWQHCPQLRDGEPLKSRRHCPLDIHDEERGYQ